MTLFFDSSSTMKMMEMKLHGVQLCVRNQMIIDFGDITKIKLEKISINGDKTNKFR